jgi:hypothetical protein
MEFLAFTILVVSAIAGFAAIFFTTFGTLIIFSGAVIHAVLTGFSVIDVRTLVILFIFYLAGEVSEYFFVILGAKKLGASNKAVVGALAGALAGAVLGAGFLGIGLFLGTFLGIFLGAFLVELFVYKDVVRSFKAGAGGLLGRASTILVKVFIALASYSVIISRFIASARL